ncbi:MAG: nucleotide sugar dehydrogenase [Candidatus Altiarchaeota archaeon]
MVQKVDKKQTTVCVVGLGYVGLPLAVEFARKGVNVIGFDVNREKVEELKQGIDFMKEFSKEEILQKSLDYTYNSRDIGRADYIIVAVPTPVSKGKKPDLSFVKSASSIVGGNMGRGSTVVYESTVYPGVTEDVCLPILEMRSGLKCPRDFKLGYSPERINPGDKEHRISSIVKIVSGCDRDTTERLAQVYGWIVKAGIYKAEDIKTAEAAKVIENAQRDLNIALMNELSLIFERMGLSTRSVIEAASTKWNFHRYTPGLVGGHCIPVDPYYLVHKAEELGYKPKVILAGRAINDHMPVHVAKTVMRELKKAGKKPEKSKVLVMGLTFKENVNDIRTSPAKKIIHVLKNGGVKVSGHDPLVKSSIVRKKFGIGCIRKFSGKGYDALVVTVPHNAFKSIRLRDVKRQMKENPVIFDVKGLFKREEAERLGFAYKRL